MTTDPLQRIDDQLGEHLTAYFGGDSLGVVRLTIGLASRVEIAFDQRLRVSLNAPRTSVFQSLGGLKVALQLAAGLEEPWIRP